MLRPIVSKLQEFCLQVGRGTKASKTPILNPAFLERGLFPELCSTSIFPTNEVSYLFPFAFFKPQSLLDLHGPVLYLIYSFLSSFIVFHSLHPPHPRRGDLCHHWQAFALKILLLQSSHLNLARQNSGLWVRTCSSYHVRHVNNR